MCFTTILFLLSENIGTSLLLITFSERVLFFIPFLFISRAQFLQHVFFFFRAFLPIFHKYQTAIAFYTNTTRSYLPNNSKDTPTGTTHLPKINYPFPHPNRYPLPLSHHSKTHLIYCTNIYIDRKLLLINNTN